MRKESQNQADTDKINFAPKGAIKRLNKRVVFMVFLTLGGLCAIFYSLSALADDYTNGFGIAVMGVVMLIIASLIAISLPPRR